MRLILCADDFAFSRAISESIAELADQGKVNAVSCMTIARSWENDASLLVGLPAAVQIGLHIVLTDMMPITAMPRLAPLGTLPPIRTFERPGQKQQPLREIEAEVKAQIGRFVAATGRAPDFIDGHQHVHLLAGIREVVLDRVAREAPTAWVRDCMDRPKAILARPHRLKAIGSAFHSRRLARDAALRGLGCNQGFAGHYGFSGNYERLFPHFLTRPGERHLVMCHPGAGRSREDPIADARMAEARALRLLPVRELAAEVGLRF